MCFRSLHYKRLGAGVGLLGEGVGRSELLDALAGEPLAHVDAVIEGLARDDTSTETTGEGITSTVSVIDGFLGDLADLELLHLDGTSSRADGDNGRESALGDNGNTGTLGVLLGELSELLGDLSDILGAPLVALE